jgi:twitching motility two-component system response regulator PilH
MAVTKVLIVDDSRTETMYLTEILQQAGYSVSSAEGAEQAMHLMAKERPELILIDVVMPGKNGYQFTRDITRSLEYGDIPIIICTSKRLETDRVWGLRQGSRDYITKPVNSAELFSKIRAIG